MENSRTSMRLQGGMGHQGTYPASDVVCRRSAARLSMHVGVPPHSGCCFLMLSRREASTEVHAVIGLGLESSGIQVSASWH